MSRPSWAPELASIPASPGVYLWSDEDGRVLYVGKAANLRARLASYYDNPPGKTGRMVETARNLRWTVTASEIDALALERTWINSHDPPFNVKLRGSGTGLRLIFTKGEVPRLVVARRPVEPGQVAYGPWPKGSVAEIVDTIAATTQVATCSASVWRSSRATGRPCLLADLGKCTAPCVSRVSVEEYAKQVKAAKDLLEGKARVEAGYSRERMREAADRLDYEKAGLHRDRMKALETLAGGQTLITQAGYSFDVAWIHQGPVITWSVVNVRGGVVTDVSSGVAAGAGVEDLDEVAGVLEAAHPGVQVCRDEVKPRGRGRKGQAVVAAVDLARLAAMEAARSESWRLRADAGSRASAANELASGLGLDKVPYHVEAVDVAHLQGSSARAAFAQLVDGIRKGAKVWKVPDEQAGDDLASMRWAVARRMKAGALPDLLVVDGGPGQLAAAVAGMEDAGLVVPVVALAKRLEEVWLPGETDPLIWARGTPALMALQHARDEAHTVSNRASAVAHRKASMRDTLDTVVGLGKVRREALTGAYPKLADLRAATVAELTGAYPKLADLRAATVAELTLVPGIGPGLARRIKDAVGD